MTASQSWLWLWAWPCAWSPWASRSCAWPSNGALDGHGATNELVLVQALEVGLVRLTALGSGQLAPRLGAVCGGVGGLCRHGVRSLKFARPDSRTDAPKIGKSIPDVKPTDVNVSNDGGCRAKFIRGYVQCATPWMGICASSKGIGGGLSHLRVEPHCCGHLMRCCK